MKSQWSGRELGTMVDATPPPKEAPVTTEKPHVPANVLWIPYFLIAFIFISFLIASFLHYHYRKRGKCRDWDLLSVFKPKEEGGSDACGCLGANRGFPATRPRNNGPQMNVSTLPVRPTISISMAHSGFSNRQDGNNRGNQHGRGYMSVPSLQKQKPGSSGGRGGGASGGKSYDAFGQYLS